jgi:hypothetical protein
MALIHLNGRSYRLEPTDEAELVALAEKIETAVMNATPVKIPVLVEGGKVNLLVNTELVDVLAFDWDGTGAGFFHG